MLHRTLTIYEPNDHYYIAGAYQEDIARITTYSVVFTPKDPKDIDLLLSKVQEAVEMLGDIPYAYYLPGYTNSGESYERPPTTDDSGYGKRETKASTCVKMKDGKVMPEMRFDLDDLMMLYYLLEPILEPNAQIAAAMNAARHDEERGAILHPDLLNFFQNSHEPEQGSGYMKDSSPEELLPDALRDIFIKYATDQIDEGELTARRCQHSHSMYYLAVLPMLQVHFYLKNKC